MKKERKQFKLTDYKNKDSLNQFNEENNEKNELHKILKKRSRKIDFTNWITWRKVPQKTEEVVFFNRKIDSIFKKKVIPTITEEVNASFFWSTVKWNKKLCPIYYDSELWMEDYE